MPKKKSKSKPQTKKKTINFEDKFRDLIQKIEIKISNITTYESNYKNDFELKFYKKNLIHYNNIIKNKIDKLIFERYDEKLKEFEEFMKINNNNLNTICELILQIKEENKLRDKRYAILDELNIKKDYLIFDFTNKLILFKDDAKLKDDSVHYHKRKYDKNKEHFKNNLQKFLQMPDDDDALIEWDLDLDIDNDETPLNYNQKILFWYKYFKWILNNNEDEWNRANQKYINEGIPIEIDYKNNLYLLIQKISFDKLDYYKLSSLNLENGGFDNLTVDDKFKIKCYKKFIKQLTIYKHTQYNGHGLRDNLIYFGEALKLLEKKYKKHSLISGNQQILIDFYNKLIILIEVSMNEQTASLFFTNNIKINTLLVKKKDLRQLSQKYSQIWLIDRTYIWGAKLGYSWVDPHHRGTPGYGSLKGFLIGLARAMIIFMQKNDNKVLDWNAFNHYKFLNYFESVSQNKRYTKSFIPNLPNSAARNTFKSKNTQLKNIYINPMNATYEDNFGNKTPSLPSKDLDSSELSPPRTDSGISFNSK